MLGVFWSMIKNNYDIPQCKTCNGKLYTVLQSYLHFKKKHNIKLTIKDLRFIFKYNIFARFIKIVFGGVMFGILFLIKMILLPIYYLYELL